MTRIGSLFSGIGGLDLAVEEFFDAETVWHSEFDPEPSKVLAARWPGVPNFCDVTKIDWGSVPGVDILCGGFPCQDLSLAGRRAGMRQGTRSGLWADFRKAIAALKPSMVIIENVRGLLSGCAESDSDVEPCPGCLGIGKQHRPLVRALGRVLGDLATLGFDAEWEAVSASDVGAPHGRFRVFVVAYAPSVRLGAWRVATTGETSRGRSSAFNSGHRGAPVKYLPTPGAASPNEEESIDTWAERRQAVKAEKKNGNGFGMPLGAAVRLLPTPMANEAEKAVQGPRISAGQKYLTNVVHERLLPTPRASRGASATETMYLLGPELDNTGDAQGNVVGDVNWAEFEPAIRRWEALTRPAPEPTRPDGKDGARVKETAAIGEKSRDAKTTENGPGETLRGMRSSDGTQEVRESVGGLNSFPESQDVLAELREHEGTRSGGDAPLARTEAPHDDMLSMFYDGGDSSRSSHRSKSGKQLTREPGHTLRELPPEETLGGRSELREARVEWGPYEAAIHRWETVLGRTSPEPAKPDGKNGNYRLNAEFSSWMMGYPAGWVTDILDRDPAIKACGNGVVPQQAIEAFHRLWPRVLERVA